MRCDNPLCHARDCMSLREWFFVWCGYFLEVIRGFWSR
ncbi:MAG: hypothetical protein [Microvirus sp.]|nr:MAG: hypothetical protein [Microvirus sp.]